MKPIAILVFSLGFFAVNAQYNSTIRSDRPGKTISAYTVGKGVLQFQHGVDFTRTEISYDFIPPSSVTYPDGPFTGTSKYETTSWQNVVRFGILENLEVNAAINYSWKNTYHNYPESNDPVLLPGNMKSQNIEKIGLGVRYNILDGDNAAGLAWGAALGTELYGWPSPEYYDDYGIILNTALSKQWSSFHFLRLNAGAEMSNLYGDRITYGLNYTVKPVPAFGITLEYAGSTNVSSMVHDSYSHIAQLGFLYFIGDHVQLDLGGGYYAYDEYYYGDGYLLTAGLSWRLKTY